MSIMLPEKLKVGFQKRADTYNGKLAFITYFNMDGSVKNERTFENWTDDKIEKELFDNVPQKGFVLNKGVKRYSSFGGNNQKIRIYDPRGFEFEITVDNLVELTQYSDINYQEITQECILAWRGNQIYLVPTNSQTYSELQNMEKASNVQVRIIDKKEALVVGNSYATKSMPYLYYMGKFEKGDFYLTTEKTLKKVSKTSLIAEISTTKKENHDNLMEMVNYLFSLDMYSGYRRDISSSFNERIIENMIVNLKAGVEKLKAELSFEDSEYVKRRILNAIYYASNEMPYLLINGEEYYNFFHNELMKKIVDTYFEIDEDVFYEKIRDVLKNVKIQVLTSEVVNGYAILGTRKDIECVVIDADNLDDLLKDQSRFVREDDLVV